MSVSKLCDTNDRCQELACKFGIKLFWTVTKWSCKVLKRKTQVNSIQEY